MSDSECPRILVGSMVATNGVCENGAHAIEVLPSVDDEHGGVIVDVKTPMEPKCFVKALRSSMAQWLLQGKKGVWMNLPITHVNLVEPAVKEGFQYHHAEPTYLMLVYWLPKTASTIPANASHCVTVGAVVFNDKNEEKSGRLRGSGFWKVPTGAVDQGEEIFTAAMREVKEETGVDTEFLEILAFRQTHASFFLKSELFFLCLLRPISFNIQKQELEIEAAQWMPFKDYISQPIVQTSEFFNCANRLCLKKIENGYAGFSPSLQPLKSVFDNKLGYFYSNKQDTNTSSTSSTSA